MSTSFKELMSKKTDEELMDYIDNIHLYTPEALTAVLNEFSARGKVFHEEKLQRITLEIERKKSKEEDDDIFTNSKSSRKYVVKDPNAPLLYSKASIFGFSAFTTTIFGAILLAINVDSTEKRIKVIGLGVLFTGLAILLGTVMPNPTLYVMGANGFGGYILATEFWDRYIGKETKHRAKSILIPLIIALAIIGLMIFGLF